MGAAIRSVIAQTLPVEHLELIVVENGSGDDTAGAARTAMLQAPQLTGRLIRSSAAGISTA